MSTRCGARVEGTGPCARSVDHPGQRHRDRDGNEFALPPGGALSEARRYYETLENALRAFGIRDGHRMRLVAELRDSWTPAVPDRDGDFVGRFDYWTTPSMSYVAIGVATDGPAGAVHGYVHKNRIADSNGDVLLRFDQAPAATSQVCPTCSMAVPATGRCDYCD